MKKIIIYPTAVEKDAAENFLKVRILKGNVLLRNKGEREHAENKI